MAQQPFNHSDVLIFSFERFQAIVSKLRDKIKTVDRSTLTFDRGTKAHFVGPRRAFGRYGRHFVIRYDVSAKDILINFARNSMLTRCSPMQREISNSKNRRT